MVNVDAADFQKIGFVNTVNILDRAPQAAVALLGLAKEFQPRQR
jgi:Skp family chaperone for outer membrane proteins